MQNRFNEESLYKKLDKLEYWKQLLFLIIVCQRLIPNFFYFEKKTGHIGGKILVNAIEKSWSVLMKGKVFVNLTKEQKECEKIAPDTEKYQTILVSSALDTAVAVSLLMKAFLEHDTKIIVEAVSLMNDTIEMYIQDMIDVDIFTPIIEEKIIQHPLMQRELNQQIKDYDFLLRLDDDLSSSIKIAHKKWFGKYYSCLIF